MIELKIEFSEYIKNFEEKLKLLFRGKDNTDQFDLAAKLPPLIMHEILAEQPLAAAIPEEYGGNGSVVKECLSVLAAASYESLPLSLTFGINIALFLEPLSKYADDSVKKEVFDRFLFHQNMGGLMITEPDYGSDALNMKTRNTELADTYSIKGTKHWQGLTGLADYWLIASRAELADGGLSRDIDFFLCDNTQKKQQIVVEEYFDTMGLHMIPYGRNILNIEVPKTFKLNPETTGIKMMLDILHRSRMQFPGMGMGFIRRMLDEAILQCKNRIVGTANLLSMDQIQFQISKIQSAYTICSAMCVRSSSISGIEHNLAAEGLEANSMKAVVTDLMQESAQILTQVSGAKGYKTSHIGGRGIMDSRPFQIFEGSNEMLYAQISEIIVRQMKKQKESNLFDFLTTLQQTAQACHYFKKELSFNLSTSLSQRKLFDLGKVIGRIVSLGYVLDLEIKGFRKELIENCIVNVKQDIRTLICAFNFDNSTQVIEDYTAESSWFNFA
ncbi:acyl-CoA dehydrogenase [Pedobacter lusitanus]|uniref:Acyl-CoA dehydrogenase n=1 Tax=Pedobacter lusitanus TaxID=1503925 RepID=A0A0D0GH75_9SPHI|nr:acyl-CoA dehydrogenase family protein [Pedobacter lusitanus]KIO76642.1 acyl-CoA dehydrogenase [Pedobacter lusitanus]